MESQWLSWAKRLSALAETGLHYCQDKFDRERYEEISALSREMMASLGAVPVERVALALGRGEGHVTPKIDVRAAIIDDGKILLVKEKMDGRWTMPGGYAEVGVSAADNTVKEVWEEAGVRVTVSRLFALRHKARHAYPPDVLDFYKLFFLCERLDDAPLDPGHEVHDAGYFSPHELPPLSEPRVIARDIADAFAFHADPRRAALID
ncbi:putative ADP-ribose pyrophosphatase YjhB [Salinicola rhizosphaerae]|uniref:ADP-ribose pyrophosphatase YjhB n=2 Tax=Salinicola rhizosphaerae TaxID=1443141 RepID=A0ABQ3DS60_9GAMM|nr:putative ADP-ribose pyrophosphatase YjhB [Salinicola rhizosphaerae]